MKSHYFGCAAVLALSAALPVCAATVNSTFGHTYSANQSLFGGESSSSFNFSIDLGVVDFQAKANSGTVNSNVTSVHGLVF